MIAVYVKYFFFLSLLIVKNELSRNIIPGLKNPSGQRLNFTVINPSFISGNNKDKAQICGKIQA